jgi:hypothetical protein
MEDNNKNTEMSQSCKNAVMRRAFAEQHRNTRHDAVDLIIDIKAKWAKTHDFSPSDDMITEMIGAIMNLKQREVLPCS